MNQTAFAVPKDKQEVAVLLNNGKTIEGTIFLEYAPGDPSVHHRMVTFLEDAAIFFPLSLKGGGGTEFIQKKNINLIELPYREDQEDLKAALSLMQTVDVTAVFLDETTIQGTIMAEVPAEKTRLSDILNLPAKFLNLKLDHRICYINKNALRKVVYGVKKG
jgi:hypothetical protein